MHTPVTAPWCSLQNIGAFDYFSEVPLNRNSYRNFSKSPRVLVLAVLFIKWKFLYLMTARMLGSWGNSKEPAGLNAWALMAELTLTLCWGRGSQSAHLTPCQGLITSFLPLKSIKNDGLSQLKLSLSLSHILVERRKVDKKI